MQIQNLAYIAIILFILYKIYNSSSEYFSDVDNKKECSQKAINDGYVSYVFGI
jgi:hypothetical protein